MIDQKIDILTTTCKTTDPEAQDINESLNDVSRMCEIGEKLKNVLEQKFFGRMKPFRRWVRMNLDKDEKSILRYLKLAENREMLEMRGVIRLSQAYELLGSEGNLKK